MRFSCAWGLVGLWETFVLEWPPSLPCTKLMRHSMKYNNVSKCLFHSCFTYIQLTSVSPKLQVFPWWQWTCWVLSVIWEERGRYNVIIVVFIHETEQKHLLTAALTGGLLSWKFKPPVFPTDAVTLVLTVLRCRSLDHRLQDTSSRLSSLIRIWSGPLLDHQALNPLSQRKMTFFGWKNDEFHKII